MKLLRENFEVQLSKGITFFQGIYTGMALLFTITLNLSASVSSDLVRVQDQAIRVISLLSAFGSLYAMISSKNKCKSPLI